MDEKNAQKTPGKSLKVILFQALVIWITNPGTRRLTSVMVPLSLFVERPGSHFSPLNRPTK
jgi:hypothetical protein